MITLLTYAWPHYKSERFLFELCAQGFKPDRVVAAPWKRLSLPSAHRMSVRHEARDPRTLCAHLGVEYEECPHEDMTGDELGIIGGARILPSETLSKFSRGILNLHPGCIPENRGLSNLARAVAEGLEPKVTAHLVDSRVDAGRLLFARRVRVEADDTPEDLSEKLLDTQVHMLAPAVRMAMHGYSMADTLPDDCGGYRKPLTANEEREIMREMWNDYRAKQAARWGR